MSHNLVIRLYVIYTPSELLLVDLHSQKILRIFSMILIIEQYITQL